MKATGEQAATLQKHARTARHVSARQQARRWLTRGLGASGLALGAHGAACRSSLELDSYTFPEDTVAEGPLLGQGGAAGERGSMGPDAGDSSSGGTPNEVLRPEDLQAGGGAGVAGASVIGGADAGVTCGAGEHPCAGICQPDTSVSSCGSACLACPEPENGQATCIAGACGVTCSPLSVDCGGRCVSRFGPASCGPGGCEGQLQERASCGALQLALGQEHTCAIIGAGEVRCWGSAGSGQLGYGDRNNVGAEDTPAVAGPVDVGGAVVQLDASNAHTCAVLGTGDVRCWGEGFGGRLGYGNSDSVGAEQTPASVGVVDVGGRVVQVAVGGSHTCALLADGQVRCWGSGVGGRLGYGDTDDVGAEQAPAAAGSVDVGGTVVQIDAAQSHTCAVLDTGAVRCWGDGFQGKLGYGNTNNVGDDETPASIDPVNLGIAATQVATGDAHTCALLRNGQVRCWGSGGPIGYSFTDSIGDNEFPAFIDPIDLGGPVVQIAAGGFHTCALRDTGDVICWGSGSGTGQLGYGNTNPVGFGQTPASVGPVNVGGRVAQIAAGGIHTCAILGTGAVRCWGGASAGQLGYGNRDIIGDLEVPADIGDVELF